MTLDIAVQRMADELQRVEPFDTMSAEQRTAIALHIRLGVYEALDILPHEGEREVVYVLTRGGVLLRTEPRTEEHFSAPAILSLRGTWMHEGRHWEVVFTEDSVVLELPIAELTYLGSKAPKFAEAINQVIGI